jgi:hypothetical protein
VNILAFAMRGTKAAAYFTTSAATLVVAWVTLVIPARAASVNLPAGTLLQIRLTTPVSSQTSDQGDPVSAVLIAPIDLPGGVIAPGARLRGVVRQVSPHRVDRQASLLLNFNRLEVGNGTTAIAAQVTDIDNARETLDRSGRILGPGTALDHPLGRLELLGLAALLPELLVVDVAGSRIREGVHVDIHYDPGVEMTLKVTKAAAMPSDGLAGPAAAPAIPLPLVQLAASQPYRTTAGRPPVAADVTNVLLVGTAAQVTDTFERAGWTTAVALSLRADVKTFLAVAGHEGYKEGPVSVQTLDGQRPDLVFQKQNDTFAKRHHVRIWRRGTWEGKPVWLAAATHDIGIKFEAADSLFTHRVDTHVDLERDKVINDLAFAGGPPAAYLDRPAVPASVINAGNDRLETDGRIAVAIFQP